MGDTVIKTTFQFRRSPAKEWTLYNPTLKTGEPGYETDTGKIKIGNGTNTWNELPYLNFSTSLSVDGSSLAIDKDGLIEIYNFKNAKTNQIPRRSAEGKIEWVNLSLRRDNYYNYDKIKDTFIPEKGEICLIDTASDGLQAICGDGKSTYGELSYVDGTLLRGYLHNNKFFKDKEYAIEIYSSVTKIYLDIPSYQIYLYNGKDFIAFNHFPTATEQIAGITKLYNSVGQNIDGTMTQKAISDELDDKIEMAINESEETLFLDYNIQ